MFFKANTYLNLFISFLFYILSLKNIISHDCISMDVAKEIFENNSESYISKLNDNLTLEEAYCGQEKLNYLIKKKYNDPVGYKVGFTGKQLQKRFKIKAPATGILYEHMFIDDNSTIEHDFAYRTFIEPDLLVIVKSSNIMNAKSELEILDNLISIHPFLELPSLPFKKETNVTGNMLVAANMLATKMIMGKGIEIKSSREFLIKLANIKTIFSSQKEGIIQEAMTSNLMGNPINVVFWLIKDFNKRGIKLKKGDRISLGSVGKLYPLSKNTSYSYKFSGFDDTIIRVNTK